jgi:hypothetical protein
MAEVQIRNILVGHGNLYAAEYGTELPALEGAGSDLGLGAPFDASAEWEFLGATQEGAELAYAPEYGEIEVDQLGDAAVMFFERSSVTLSTQLAEATLENLLIAWGFEDDYVQQSAGGEVTQFSLGVHGSDPVERTVAVVGKGAAGPDGERRDRVYHGRRVLSIEGSSLALRRGENTAYPVSLRLLADPAFPNSEYGVIIDRIPGDATEAPNPDPFYVAPE